MVSRPLASRSRPAYSPHVGAEVLDPALGLGLGGVGYRLRGERHWLVGGLRRHVGDHGFGGQCSEDEAFEE